MDVRIFNKDTGSFVGTISKADMQFLVDQLEEESESDTDYFVDSNSIDALEELGGSPALISLLRLAVGTSDGVEIRWEFV